MFSHQVENLARLKSAEISRVSDQRPEGRSSLRIILDARRARRQSKAG